MKDFILRVIENIIQTAIMIAMIAPLALLFIWQANKSMMRADLHNLQTKCGDALVSGNQEYLEKCSCFYQSEDITCVMNKIKKDAEKN